MNHKIIILGKGFIGNRLMEELGLEAFEKKVFSFQDAQDIIKQHNPQVLINCIGHTGKNVDSCEQDKEKTLMANTYVPILLAEACLRNNVKLVHISSGCIYHYDYNRNIPILETDTPDFFELFYSRSKIYSEYALNALAEKYPILILRIRIPLDNRPHPKNLLDKLIAYKKAINVANSVTYIPDFLRALKHLLEIQAVGIYNMVNKGGLEYPKLLETYKKYRPNFTYEVIDYRALNLVRTNLILSTEKLEAAGFKVRQIDEVLEECVKDYLKYL